MTAVLITALTGIIATVLACFHGHRTGIERAVTYSSDRHAGIEEGLARGRRERQPEIDELRTHLDRAREDLARVRRELADIARIDQAYDDAIAARHGGQA